jgi:hypothetical protein
VSLNRVQVPGVEGVADVDLDRTAGRLQSKVMDDGILVESLRLRPSRPARQHFDEHHARIRSRNAAM